MYLYVASTFLDTFKEEKMTECNCINYQYCKGEGSTAFLLDNLLYTLLPCLSKNLKIHIFVVGNGVTNRLFGKCIHLIITYICIVSTIRSINI